MLIKVNIATLCYQKIAPKGDDDSNFVGFYAHTRTYFSTKLRI